VVDELGDESRGQGIVEDDGIPMLLVHVIAGDDGLIFFPELKGPVGIALEVHPALVVFESEGGEHLAEDLVDEGVGAEGGLLRDLWKGQDVGAAVVDGKVHWWFLT